MELKLFLPVCVCLRREEGREGELDNSKCLAGKETLTEIANICWWEVFLLIIQLKETFPTAS